MGNPADITPYTYNATWKDKLATYNGQTITSDAIGNTLNDGVWTYYWEMGRRLWQMEKGNYGDPNSVLMNFNYNAEGVRIGKLCDSHNASGNNSYVYTDYYVHGKKIMHMKQNGSNLHFFYDAQERPAVVNYNGVKYAYILNLQDKSDPSHELLVAICRMYSVSSDFLLGLTDDDPLFRKDDPLTPENHSALQRFKAFLLDNQNKK